ncbi:MAG: AbrB/MazE/SpoVT family DNA-binding domain-containing protein [Candidatus Dormibacteraceae bacterium]
MSKVKNRSPRLSSKNQITIPVRVLRKAHVKAGDEFRVEADEEGRIVMSRADDPLEKFIGDLPGLSKATNLQRLRDEWGQ